MDQKNHHKNLWLSWNVSKDIDEESQQTTLLSKNYRILETTDSNQVRTPILSLSPIAQQYGWLKILRNPYHIPEDPMELVRFIQKLENIV